MSDNKSLAKKLADKELLEEFCSLMFDTQVNYKDLLEQLEKWGISSSIGALSRFSDSQRSQWTLARAKRQYESMLEDAGTTLDEAQKRVVAERLYGLAASPNISEKALLKMRDQEIKMAVLSQNDRKLTLLEAKVNAANEVMDDTKLSPEEKVHRWKAVFGR